MEPRDKGDGLPWWHTQTMAHFGPSTLSFSTPHTSKLNHLCYWSMKLLLVSDSCSHTYTLPHATLPTQHSGLRTGSSPAAMPRLPAPSLAPLALTPWEGKERAQLSTERLRRSFWVGCFAEVTKHTLPPWEHPEPSTAPPDPTAPAPPQTQ